MLRCFSVVRRALYIPGWLRCCSRREKWEDPQVFADRKLATHASLQYHKTKEEAESGTGSGAMNLSGSGWHFRLLPTPREAVALCEGKGGSADWHEVVVPMNWQMQGFEPPCYTNITYPWTSVPALAAPDMPKQNPTGVYRRRFNIPEAWLADGRRVRVLFHGAGGALQVWVNGEYVGYSQDSYTGAEFDITDALRRPKAANEEPLLEAGSHELSAMTPKWSDGSYLEDQDTWWLSGLHRDVELLSRPALAFDDFEVDASIGGESSNPSGMLRVKVRLSGAAPSMDGFQIQLSLATLDGVSVGDTVKVEHFTSFNGPGGERALLAQARMRIPSVRPWTAETPVLYRLSIVLIGESGEQLQAQCCRVGFRSVAIIDGQLCVNRRPLVIAGANVHEMHPTQGRALREEDMLADIVALKRGNFNAVRNSHYPHSLRWYELCDEHGLYVVDEVNIETHGFALNGMISLLACELAWRAQILHRAQNMFRRTRNYACVIGWSLGNESGFGPNLQACGDWLRENDSQTRPIQYEGGSKNGDAILTMGDGTTMTSDIICPMYTNPEGTAKLSSLRERPVILCEYCHMLGNAGGSLATFWELFWSDLPEHRRAQGGFIWEWADGAVSVPDRVGGERGELGYGGDFGADSGATDAHFICDGMLFPDRTPHPSYYEARRLQQPVAFRLHSSETSADDVLAALAVRNRYGFTSLGHLTVTWRALDGVGTVVGQGELSSQIVKAIAAGDESIFNVRVPVPRADLVRCGLWLRVEAALASPAAWAPEGHVVAEQVLILIAPASESASGNPDLSGSLCPLSAVCIAPSSPGSSGATLEKSSGGEEATLKTLTYEVVVRSGKLVSMRAPGGQELLAQSSASVEVAGLGHCFARAPTDDDRGGVDTFVPWLRTNPLTRSVLKMLDLLSNHGRWLVAGLQNLHGVVQSANWSVGPGGDPRLVVSEVFRVSAGRGPEMFTTVTTYTFGPEAVSIGVEVAACAPARALPALPRVGLHVALASRLSRVTWLGRGPGESYPDRKACCDWAVHSSDVAGLHVDYIVPSECGGKADVHWVALVEPSASDGLLFRYSSRDSPPPPEALGGGAAGKRPAGTSGAQLNVSRWTRAELTAAAHNYELPACRDRAALAARPVQVHLDTAHLGVGAAGEKPDTLTKIAPQFLMRAEATPWTYNVELRPVGSDWLHTSSA